MKCQECKSFDVMFDEKKSPIVYSCNGCGYQWHNREMYFESFLKEEHGKQCNLPNDMWPDDYEKWLQCLSVDEWIDLGERYGKSILKKGVTREMRTDIEKQLRRQYRIYNLQKKLKRLVLRDLTFIEKLLFLFKKEEARNEKL